MVDRALAGALQVTPATLRLYERLLTVDGSSLEQAANSLNHTLGELTEAMAPLVEQDIVAVVDGRIRVRGPQEALGRLLLHESRVLSDALGRLTQITQVIPKAATMQPEYSEPGTRVDAEVVGGSDVEATVVSWVEQGRGDVLILRPDQWLLPSEPEMFAVIARAIHAGRRIRAIYPVRAIKEAPQVLLARAAAGEQVRVLPEVPTRMAVVGSDRAIFPDPPGHFGERSVMVRHPGVVALLTGYFDALWDRAVALPERGAGAHLYAERRLLLAELASGSRDEQIARTLGLSLRTVRRRIADLMIELGVDTRFQAGVEAARRGWL
ncbi:response regulator transcription factor [Nocardioides campestrisoli]|uniref:response regulator transcription factor n=1 Tax=Nocardioides campestrisoli TaxID=2736757 RepID=UPI0015E6FBE7|nr:response regulator transcription factor [Nocardioides campestrisoli]